MKKALKFTLMFGLTSVLFLGSCKKDATAPVNTNPAVSELTCKVNGTTWNIPSNKAQAYLMNDTFGISAYKIENNDTAVINFIVKLTSAKTGKYTGSGSYITSPIPYAFYIASLKDKLSLGDIFLGSMSFELNITKIDEIAKKASGTFSFTQTKASGTKDIISEGSFNNLDITK